MVFDATRNAAYRRAIEASVTKDSVVLDLGAGLGVLGLMAARAGARQVYLVEPESIAEVTRRIVRDSGLANIEVIESPVEKLQLPEPVDLILSVFTGNFLLTEDLLPLLFLARDRFLKPGGRLLPDRACMRLAPVTATDYHARHVAVWGEHEMAATDFSAARPYAANTVYYDHAKEFAAQALADPATLMELDFTRAASTACDHAVETTANRAGDCHGWMGWFDMHLAGEWLSTGPEATPLHWCPVLLPLESGVTVAAGDALTLQLRRPEYGDWHWRAAGPGWEYQHSSFLSSPLKPERVLKASDRFAPRLGDRGQAAAWVLARFDGGTSVEDIARELGERWPELHPLPGERLEFVRKLAVNFG